MAQKAEPKRPRRIKELHHLNNIKFEIL